MTELARVVSQVIGRQLSYTDLPLEQYQQVFVGAGLAEPMAAVFADSDRGIAAGELVVDTADLRKLLGRPATSLTDAVGAAAGLRGIGAGLPDLDTGLQTDPLCSCHRRRPGARRPNGVGPTGAPHPGASCELIGRPERCRAGPDGGHAAVPPPRVGRASRTAA